MDDVSFLYKNSSAPLRRVKFVPAAKPDKVALPEDLELIHLKLGRQSAKTEVMPRTAQTSRNAAVNGMSVLFKEEDVKHGWEKVKRVGAGLENLGNTCFMNSVLQCLTHTPPLAEVLLNMNLPHSAKEFDVLRTTQQHFQRSLSTRPGGVVSPRAHVRSLQTVNKSFRVGRQEDAHEYLIALLDAMHESLLAPLKPKPARSVQETSMIFQIFAGRICSQVKCTDCGSISKTIDPFLDISLEITHASTLERALQRFTATEYLEGENKYICPKEKTKVRAAKRISIEKAPNVLVLQLKRFTFGSSGHKIVKQVEYGTDLDIAPYMSDKRAPPMLYQLYGVLVHYGHSVNSGHYFCFVRAPNQTWYQMDDDSVTQVSERSVLGQKAYILFYIRKAAEEGPLLPAVPRGPAQAAEQAGKEDAAPSSSVWEKLAAGQSLLSSPPAKRKMEPENEFSRKRQSLASGQAAPQPQSTPAGNRQPQVGSETGGGGGTAAKLATGGPVLAAPSNRGVDPQDLQQQLASHSQATPSQQQKPSTTSMGRHPLIEQQLRKGQAYLSILAMSLGSEGGGMMTRTGHRATSLSETHYMAGPQKPALPDLLTMQSANARRSSVYQAIRSAAHLGGGFPLSSSPCKTMQGRSHRGFEQTLHLHKQAVGRNGQSRGNTPTGLGSPGLRGSSPQAGNEQPAQPSAKAQAGGGDRRSPRVKLTSLLGDSPLQQKPAALSNLKPAEKKGSGAKQAVNPSRSTAERPETVASALGNGSRNAALAAAEKRSGDAAEKVEGKGSEPPRALPQRLEERMNEAATPQQGAAVSSGAQAPAGAPGTKAEQEGDEGPTELPPHGAAEPRSGTENGNAPGLRPDEPAETAPAGSPSSTAKRRRMSQGNATASPEGKKATTQNATSDPGEVRAVLGVAGPTSGGPVGAEPWPDAAEETKREAKREAEEYLRSLERKKLDEYDEEYDRGKTKKVRGLRQADNWATGADNVFQHTFSSRRQQSRSLGGRKHRRSG